MVRLLVLLMGAIVVLIAGQVGAGENPPLIDPLRPLRYQSPLPVPKTTQAAKDAVDTKSLSLTAVLISDQRSVAIINGASFQIGDSLEGYQIVRIYADRVVLKKKSKKRVLWRVGTGLRKDIR